jgi:hypothetical protein
MMLVGDTVFVNKRSVVHAGSAGQTTAFPDVCLCPPTPPAGPIPTPLPNLAMASDTQGGATSVLVEGNPMGKKSSFFAKSTGNEVAQSTGGGVVTHVVQGKAYFTSYSLDVTVEGEEVPRHLDMMTQNHMAQSPPNAAVGTYLAMMDPGAMPSASEEPDDRKDDDNNVEFYIDQVDGKAPQGIEQLQLVSEDGAYDKKLPVSSAPLKGGIYCVKFEKVLPNKFYSLYWYVAGEKMAMFENVAFSRLAAHAPGVENSAHHADDPGVEQAAPPDDTADAKANGDEQAAADDEGELPDLPSHWLGEGAEHEIVDHEPEPGEHPDDFYIPRPWDRTS